LARIGHFDRAVHLLLPITQMGERPRRRLGPSARPLTPRTGFRPLDGQLGCTVYCISAQSRARDAHRSIRATELEKPSDWRRRNRRRPTQVTRRAPGLGAAKQVPVPSRRISPRSGRRARDPDPLGTECRRSVRRWPGETRLCHCGRAWGRICRRPRPLQSSNVPSDIARTRTVDQSWRLRLLRRSLSVQLRTE
jgi:hypothetical protein